MNQFSISSRSTVVERQQSTNVAERRQPSIVAERRQHLAWDVSPRKNEWKRTPAPKGRQQLLHIFLTLTLVVPALAAHAHDASQLTNVSDQEFDQRSRELFDGTVLAGWEGNSHWFHIDDETIVAGRLEKPIPENQFLCTTDTFADFDLRLEVRMRGEDPNAGVQFRSRRPRQSDGVPANEVVGYQADMGNAWGRSVWGGLYDESRRQKMLAEPETPFAVKWTTPQAKNADAGTAEAAEAIPETEWVRMRIVCKGDQIEIFLNDHLTVRYQETDPEIPGVGMIGLQIHSGPPAEACYRNIRILSL